MKNLNLKKLTFIFTLTLAFSNSYAQLNCFGEELNPSDFSEEILEGGKKGLSSLPNEIRQEIKKVERFFSDVNITFYVTDGFNICHEYEGFKTGKIKIGRDFIEKYNNPVFIATVIAHEFGHNLQKSYEKSNKLNGKFKELQCDVIAGYYAVVKLYEMGEEYGDLELAIDKILPIRRYYGNVANLEVTDKDHGDAQDRMEAFQEGVNNEFKKTFYKYKDVFLSSNYYIESDSDKVKAKKHSRFMLDIIYKTGNSKAMYLSSLDAISELKKNTH